MANKKTDKKAKKEAPAKKTEQAPMVFKRTNYVLLIASLVVILIGFLLMHGSENIFDFRKITLAPLVVLAGFALAFVSILYHPKS